MNLKVAYNEQVYIKFYLGHRFKLKYVASNELYMELIDYTARFISNQMNMRTRPSLEQFLLNL